MTWISCLAAESLSHRHRPRTYFCIDVLPDPDVRCMSLPGGPLLHLTSPPHQPTRDIQPDPENAPERGGPRALAARCGEAESACVSASLERSFWGSVALALAVGASTSPDDIPILDSGVSLPRGSQHTYIDLSSRQDVLFSVLSGRWLDVVLSPAIATHLRVIYIYIYI